MSFRNHFNLYTYLLLCLLAASCRKQKDETEVTYVNQAPAALTLKIYPNMDAYATSTMATYSGTMPASDKLLIPGKTFAQGLSYYADWYSGDYLYNNWFNDKYPSSIGTVAISPRVGANTFYASVNNRNYNRVVFLNGVGTQTTWQAVDAYQYSAVTGYVSVWNSMQNAEKVQHITIRKDFTATYNYKDQYGADKTQELEFKVHNTQHSYIEFLADGGATTLGSMVGGTLPTATPPNYASSSVDTVMALLPGSDLKFMMVRQP